MYSNKLLWNDRNYTVNVAWIVALFPSKICKHIFMWLSRAFPIQRNLKQDDSQIFTPNIIISKLFTHNFIQFCCSLVNSLNISTQCLCMIFRRLAIWFHFHICIYEKGLIIDFDCFIFTNRLEKIVENDFETFGAVAYCCRIPIAIQFYNQFFQHVFIFVSSFKCVFVQLVEKFFPSYWF